MRLNLPTFIGFRLEEDLQGFVDKIEKIFRVMHATDCEGVDFAAYQLKDIAY